MANAQRSATEGGYQQTLAAIGRFFDQQRSRGIFLAEVDEGYIGKAYPFEQEAELRAEGFTFPREDLDALNLGAGDATVDSKAAPHFCSDGYAAFLSAFGAQCDRAGASYISVLELADGFLVSYTAARGKKSALRYQALMHQNEIDELLDVAPRT